MDRKSHYLRSTSGDCYPSNWICADFAISKEEDGHIGRIRPLTLLSVSAIACRASHRGKLAMSEYPGLGHENFWAWVASKLRRGSATWLFSMQAMLLLDLTHFWDELEASVIEVYGRDPRDTPLSKNDKEAAWKGYAVTEDPPTIILVRNPITGGTLKIVDVRNYGIDGWEDVGYTNPRPDAWGEANRNNDKLPEFVACERVKLLNSLVLQVRQVLSESGMGSLQSTASSQAMYSFKRKYLRDPILIDGRETIHDFEKTAYYCGRNEATRLGKVEAPVYHLDVNSHYLSVSVDNPVPVEMLETLSTVRVEDMPLLLSENLAISRVLIDTKEPAYPYNDGEVTYYPIGRFWTTLCSPELEYALMRGHVQEVEHTQLYVGRRIFECWSDDLWMLRKRLEKEGKAWGSKFIKRVAVSLFGKFSQRGLTWKDRPEVIAGYPYRQWTTEGDTKNAFKTFRAIAYRTQELIQSGWNWDSFPAISAFINSYGRIKLWSLIAKVGIDQTMYYDTDSIWCLTGGYHNAIKAGLIGQDELGKLKLVEQVPWMRIYGLKNYEIPSKRTLAGMSKRLVEYLGGEGIGYRVPSFSEFLKARVRPNSTATYEPPTEFPPYKHGVLTADNRIVPRELPERGF